MVARNTGTGPATPVTGENCCLRPSLYMSDHAPLLFSKPPPPPPTHHTHRRLLMCRVTLGKPMEQLTAVKIAHAPPGHHSVIGRPSTGGLNYPEYVIYRGEQVRDGGLYIQLSVDCISYSYIAILEPRFSTSVCVQYPNPLPSPVHSLHLYTPFTCTGISRVPDHLPDREATRH